MGKQNQFPPPNLELILTTYAFFHHLHPFMYFPMAPDRQPSSARTLLYADIFGLLPVKKLLGSCLFVCVFKCEFLHRFCTTFNQIEQKSLPITPLFCSFVMDFAIFSAVCLALAFFVLLLGGVVIPRASLIFTKRLGRPHAMTGAIYLVWLLFGFYDAMFPLIARWKYDTMLGILGIVLTLTAAFNFGHKNVHNIASGTLDEHALVTYNEMIEHSFYQVLNLIQAWYLHSVCRCSQEGQRLLLVMIATSPWLARRFFPIHPFSANYLLHDDRSTTFIREMYRAKKYQYMFYKHFLLHGLNVSAAFSGVCLCDTQIFRYGPL